MKIQNVIEENAESVVKTVLGKAKSFHRRHGTDRAARSTFGYFTRHPVAPLNQRRLRMLADSAQERSQSLGRPLRVLDLGCGGGVITCTIAALGHQTLGLDLSRDEVRMAKLFATEETLSGKFLRADLLKDPDWEKQSEEVLGGKPDLVTLAYALHHLPEVESVIERLSWWLGPDSLLLVNEENPRSPLFRLKHLVRTWIQKDTETEWHRSFEGWKAILHEAGFAIASPPVGADMIPALDRLLPERCWSLVFTAQLNRAER
ncbi:MAG: class I SAM-dependent methyltransferase [Oligoflexia bacterium]|nr:class I SAM-dependent methyltransferase [Oligoflexia bacterium]